MFACCSRMFFVGVQSLGMYAKWQWISYRHRTVKVNFIRKLYIFFRRINGERPEYRKYMFIFCCSFLLLFFRFLSTAYSATNPCIRSPHTVVHFGRRQTQMASGPQYTNKNPYSRCIDRAIRVCYVCNTLANIHKWAWISLNFWLIRVRIYYPHMLPCIIIRLKKFRIKWSEMKIDHMKCGGKKNRFFLCQKSKKEFHIRNSMNWDWQMVTSEFLCETKNKRNIVPFVSLGCVRLLN